MKKHVNEVQELKGIGKVLSQRLCESSYDTIAKVASATVKGLERVAGLHPHKAHEISLQARQMTGAAEKSHHSWSEQRDVTEQQVAQDTVLSNRDRFKGQ